MISVPCLVWASTPQYKGPVSINSFDPTIDIDKQFLLQGMYLDVPVAPRFVVVDNFYNEQDLTVSFDNIDLVVGRFERRTMAVPLGAQRCLVHYVQGTKTVTPVYISVEDLGYGNAVNSFAIQQTTPGGGGVSFTSTPQAIVAGGLIALAHLLGGEPKGIMLSLVCLVADNGFAIGDIIAVDYTAYNIGPGSTGIALRYDATNIYIRYSTAAAIFPYLTKVGAPNIILTNASWNLIVKAVA